MKFISKDRVIYSFSPWHSPVERVSPGELVLMETEDALGGQVKDEKTSVEELDWTKVNAATGPVFVEGAEPGDTLVVEILEIRPDGRGVIVTVPKCGILGDEKFGATTKIVTISEGYVHFNDGVRVRARPMIGTIGVAPEAEEVPSGSLGRHGGNMDVNEVAAGARLYLPVFVEGALFAAGDVHAVQADGELCVSAVEVASRSLLRLDLIKGRAPQWPVLETRDCYALLACAETLSEAAALASEAAVKAIMREYGWPFEKAYMFGSLAVNLKINQVVDPKKGVRAVISKGLISLKSLLPKSQAS